MSISVLVLCLFPTFLNTPAVVQQSATYAEEYALYQQAQAETNAAQQKQLVLQFVQKYQTSELDAHIAYLYSQHLTKLRDRGDWSGLAKDSEEFLRSRPGDKVAAAMATEAYQRLGQSEKVVQLGTRLYNQSPSGATAYNLAKAYQAMNDAANFQKWAEKTLQHAPDSAEMWFELIRMQWQAGNLPKAAEMATRALKGIAAKPETATVRAFAMRAQGQNSYLNGEAAAAQKFFAESLKLDPKNDFAHLQMGYCQWRTGRIDEAIQSFAKAVALKGDSAKDARQQLYGLLKTRYGSTENASKIIEAASKELGV